MRFITKTRVICGILLAGILIVNVAGYVTSKNDRLLLYFEDAAGNIGTEVRYVPRNLQKPLSETVITELLLGPVDRRFVKLADPSIVPSRCFVRNGTLYVDFPETILSLAENTTEKPVDFKTVYRLMQKNIFTNCKDIHTIHVYIGGIQAYQNS